MRRLSLYITILLIITIIPSISSCEKHEDILGDIDLPPALLLSESESWAVIDAPYLRLREHSEVESRLVTTLFKGYVLKVKSRTPEKTVVDDEEDFWYQVSYDGLQGWVFGSYLEIFDNSEAAEIKARAIRSE